MITQLFNNPHVLYQTADSDFEVSESAIGASVDGGGIIVLEQDGSHIVVNKASVPELCRLLRKLAQEGQ